MFYKAFEKLVCRSELKHTHSGLTLEQNLSAGQT